MSDPREHEWWPLDLMRQAAMPFLVALIMLCLLLVWFAHAH